MAHTQDTFYNQVYPNIREWDINFFTENKPNNNIIFIDSHTDNWVDLYIQEQLNCKTQYFHKKTLQFSILGNWDIERNKKDMNYNTNTCNHIWTIGKSKIDIEKIISNIKGKTIYAVWDFDYLYKATVIKNVGYYTTKFVTFTTKKAAKQYLDSHINNLSEENDKRKMWQILQKGRGFDMFMLQHKSFREVHTINIPDNIFVMSIADFINEMKDFYKQYFYEVYKQQVVKFDQEFMCDSPYYLSLSKKERQEYYEKDVYNYALSHTFTYNKKVIQNYTHLFRSYLEEKYGR